MTVWEAWNVQYLSCQPYISPKVEYRVCGKHLSLDTPTADCCVGYLSLIGPNRVCRVCETLVSRILDAEREVFQEYILQKSQCQVSSMRHTGCLLKLLVLLIERVWSSSQVISNVDIHIVRFMSLGNLIVELRVWCISHCSRNDLLILSLFLPYVRSRIVASYCSQLRCFSWFP
jgi:hypothetical protein